MEPIKINIIAILIAVVVNFILGWLWYTPLFGKLWGREMGYDMNEKPASSELMKGMVFMIIGNFLFAWVLAHNMAAWSFVPGTNENIATTNAIMAAVFTWLGFYFPGDLGSTSWEKKSWTLFFINTGYHLVSLLVVALIISYWPA
ncbi:MAG TPA: DUF1761 domain-containing protein [Saprospiraceae bacterium]|nr:DUF1761 domain-containing protein [Saprospiraceae bacterium]HNG67697.1 DUF1761 domain-containing protein [Saprospiraceae bacterium]